MVYVSISVPATTPATKQWYNHSWRLRFCEIQATTCSADCNKHLPVAPNTNTLHFTSLLSRRDFHCKNPRLSLPNINQVMSQSPELLPMIQPASDENGNTRNILRDLAPQNDGQREECRYKLTIIEQPLTARAIGTSDRDRRCLDPVLLSNSSLPSSPSVSMTQHHLIMFPCKLCFSLGWIQVSSSWFSHLLITRDDPSNSKTWATSQALLLQRLFSQLISTENVVNFMYSVTCLYVK